MKLYKYLYILFPLAVLTGCEMNEDPKSEASVKMVFSSEKGLQTYAYSFYYGLPDRDGALKQEEIADYCARTNISGMMNASYTVNASTSWSWTRLRNVNFFLENNINPAVPENVRNNYNGVARFFRAYFYFAKLVKYGGVPWIEKTFNDPDDPAQMNPRDSRDVIIEHIMDDLDYAYKNITANTTPNSSLVSKWCALALKSRACLFEASWRKYHANDEYDFARTGCEKYKPEDLYKIAAEAAKEIMDKGPYKLFKSASYANGRGSYRELFIADNAVTEEVMLAVECDQTLGGNFANWYFYGLSNGLSMTRQMAKTYLNIDGSPYNEKNADGTYKTLAEETTGRDLRMNQTIRCADYTEKHQHGDYRPAVPNMVSVNLTGYQFTKYVLDDDWYNGQAANENDLPLMRFAEVLLNYAEAKAELGELTDDDWARTVGALRDRAGIKGGTPSTGTLTTKPTEAEPYIASIYPGVTDPVILEIRRDRACELILEGFRLNDLKRWACIDLWEKDPWEGIFFPEMDKTLDLNGDGKVDVYFYDSDTLSKPIFKGIAVYLGTNNHNLQNAIKVDGGYIIRYNMQGRSWPARQYLYPIPEIVRQKNPNLEQNPGW